ncbi:hypothetical protein H0H93_010166 [Arthromyces matolae]|nr:hypothetical protein H0H93_010166 [Arthromyces matolae]
MSVTTPHEHQSGLDISSLTDLSADRARRLIDQEVQRLEDSIRALRSHRNVLAPISHLPPEMLSKVFAYRVADCLGNAPLEWIRVTHVSRHWRAVAFDCPSLWGHLVFTRPKWCQEMLKRSKMASLVVKADLTCITPRIFEAVRLALLHAPRIHDLQLRAGSATIQRLLTAEPAFQLPMIRSLSLSVPPAPRFGTDEGFELPETILTGETPYLRRLELHKVNVAWDSQLLQGLTHLTIHDVSASARPTMELFMDALERMSALEVLDIQNALPQSPLGSASDRVVELRHLAQLKITSTVPECGNLATHITIPPSARVHLSCSGTEASGGDFSSVMKLISNPRGAGRHPDGCAPDRKIIRVLHVRHEAPISLVVQGWTDALSVREAHPQINTPDIQLHFSWHHTPQTAVNSVTSAICKVIPIAHLRSLRMEQVDGFNSKIIYIFGSLILTVILRVTFAAPTPSNIAVARRYAPQWRFHTSEIYWPSTVEYFLAGVKQVDEKGNVVNGIVNSSNVDDPANHGSGLYLTTDIKSGKNGFLRGQNPSTTSTAVYAFIAPKDNGVVDVYYWLFTPFNEGKHISALGEVGDHVGDWERMAVRTVNGVATQVDYHAHSDDGSGTIPWDHVVKFDNSQRPVGYVAKGSHGFWATKGTFTYVNAVVFKLQDITSDNGLYWDTKDSLVTYAYPDGFSGSSDWLNYRGYWGNAGQTDCWWYKIHNECEVVTGPDGPYRPDVLGGTKLKGAPSKAIMDGPMSQTLGTVSQGPTSSFTFYLGDSAPKIASGYTRIALKQTCKSVIYAANGEINVTMAITIASTYLTHANQFIFLLGTEKGLEAVIEFLKNTGAFTKTGAPRKDRQKPDEDDSENDEGEEEWWERWERRAQEDEWEGRVEEDWSAEEDAGREDEGEDEDTT